MTEGKSPCLEAFISHTGVWSQPYLFTTSLKETVQNSQSKKSYYNGALQYR